MGTYTTFPIPNRTLTDYNKKVYLSDYLTGVGDQTANVNAAFAVLAGGSGTLVWNAGRVVVTDTIICGSNGHPNNSGPASFISIECPLSTDQAGIDYNGPTDRPALLMCKNKFFWVKGFSVRNIVGSKGTSVGIMLGGQGGGAGSGTQTLSGSFYDCIVVGFATGIQAGGNFGDASEHIFHLLKLYENDIGFFPSGFNSLNFQFNLLGMSANGIGLHSGASDGYHVFTGSATNNSICDFFVDGNGNCSITGFRQETGVAAPMVKGNFGRSVALRSCQVFNSATKCPAVNGTFSRIAAYDNTLDGWIETSSSLAEIVLINNVLRVDPNTKLPFFLNLEGSLTAEPRVKVQNNLDFLAVTPVSNIDGIIRHRSLDANPFQIDIVDPAVLRVPEIAIADNSAPEFGAEYMALSRVRQLAEGPVPGNTVNTSTPVVTNAITAAGSPVLHFASVPDAVVPFQQVENLTTPGSLPFGLRVISKTATTVTLNGNAIAGGVGSGDNIRFWNILGVPTPGKNLRVTGTFAGSNSFTFLFQRTLTVTGPGFTSQTLTATAGRFYPTDVGKPIRIVGQGNSGWTDMYGNIVAYIDSTHAVYEPGLGQIPGNIAAGSTTIVGEDEPDSNFIIAGLVGDVNENFWVTNFLTSGFTMHSSNAASTANLVALIVR